VLRKADTTSWEEHKTAAFLDMMGCNVAGRSTFQTKLLPVKLHGVTFQIIVATFLTAMRNSDFTL